MNVILKNLTFVAVFVATLCAASAAQAQMLSGRGVESRAMGEVSCIAEIERLEITVQNLETQRDAMIECNENGAVFTGSFDASNDPICEPLAPLNAVWNPTPGSPSELEFFDSQSPPNQVGPTITVIRGEDGVDATSCPSGYVPTP